MRPFLRFLLPLVCLLSFCATLQAQDTPDKIDVRPYAPHDGSSLESVSLTNGSLVMNIPLWSFHQRGKLKLDFDITYDSPNFDFSYNCTYFGAPQSAAQTSGVTPGLVSDTAKAKNYYDNGVDLATAQPDAVPGNPCPFPFCVTNGLSACSSYWELSQFVGDGSSWRNDGTIGIRITSSTDYAIVPEISVLQSSSSSPYQLPVYYGYFFKLLTPDGGSHNLTPTPYGDYRSVDGEGYRYTQTGCKLTDAEGTVYTFNCADGAHDGVNPTSVAGVLSSIEDVSGNRITYDPTTGWIDTEGRVIPPIGHNITSGTAVGCPAATTNVATWQIPGVTAPIGLCYTTVPIATNIQWPKYSQPGFSQATEYDYNVSMISGIVLPSHDAWNFSYDPLPADALYGSGFNYGNLSQITLPTGGTIQYTWDVNHATCGSNSRTVRSSVTTRTLRADSAATPAIWRYGISGNVFDTTNASAGVTSVTDPLGNVDSHTLSYLANCTFFDTRVDHYDNQAHLLRSETTDFETLPVLPALPYVPVATAAVLPIAKHTIWPDGKTQTTAYTYDSGYTTTDSTYTQVPYGNKTSETEYDFGTSSTSTQTVSGIPTTVTTYNDGPALKTQTMSYWIDGNAQGPSNSPLTWNILRPLKQVTTQDGATNKTQTTQYGYDENTTLVSGNASASTWDANPPNGAVRGNQTSVQKYLDTTGTYLRTNVGYTNTGMVSSITLPHDASTPDTTTTYSYASAYQGGLLTGITDALGHTTSYTYNALTDQPLTATDPNNATSTYTYYDDTRLHTVTLPTDAQGHQGETEYRYPTPTEVDSRIKQTASTWLAHHDLYDGLGRKAQSVLVGGCGVSGDILTDTGYDLLDRVATESNPHCTGGSSSTDGTTTHTYDALNRPVTLTHPDLSYQSWSYPADTTTNFTDESRTSTWSRTTDALGHLVQVLEPDPNTGIPTLSTTYTYDAFNNLTGVNQAGAAGETPRTRSFSYDSLSRLLTTQNPETGILCYGQWAPGTNPNPSFTPNVTPPPIHLPPPGGGGNGPGPLPTNHSSCQSGYDTHSNLVAKTDANGTVITYGYDALNRLVTKTSTDDDTNAQLAYDHNANGIGRLSAETVTDQSGHTQAGTAFAYDALGRTTSTLWYKADTAAWATGMSNLQYDYAGNLTQLQYPDGRLVHQTWDAANRLATVTDNTPNAAPVTYFGNGAPAQYFPSGALQSVAYGNGITSTLGLNNRLQPCLESAAPTGTTTPLFQRQLFYGATPETNCGAAANNNGNIASVLEGPTLGTSQGFTYDKLNRLTGAASTNRPASSAYNQTYSYDSFGNMLPTDNLNAAPNYSREAATNRLLLNGSDFTYDNAGELISAPAITGFHSLTYTAEGYLRAIDTGNVGNYLYNSLGERTVAGHNSTAWNQYIYLNSQPMADLDQTGTWTDTIYANGQKIARVASAKPVFQLQGNRSYATNTMACGLQAYLGNISATMSAIGSIQSGDFLSFDEKTPASDTGTFANGSLGFYSGGQGHSFGNDTETQTDGQWHHYNEDLSSFAGIGIDAFGAYIHNDTPEGDWLMDFANILYTRADGTVLPVFNGSSLYVYTDGGGGIMGPYNSCGSNGLYASLTTVPVDATEGASYFLDDQLGTTQMELSAGGTVLWQGAFTPFGQEIVNGIAPTYLGTQPADGTNNRYKFTGKERDNESGFDYFGARYYASGMGRWTTADWSAKPEAIPYSKLDNPQSLNLYNYVNNNPLSKADPDGHCCEEEENEDEVKEEASFETDVARAGRQAHADEFNERRQKTQPGSAPLSPAEVDNAEADGKLALHDMLHPNGDMLDRDTQTKVDRDIERVSRGRAPLGDDGHPMELHHEDQTPNGPVKEMTRTEHRLGENFKKNHKNTGQHPSKIDRREHRKFVRKYWKDKGNK